MSINNIIAAIDSELERLQRARALLSSPAEVTGANQKVKRNITEPVRRKRVLSPEALERIRAGQRRRWANVNR